MSENFESRANFEEGPVVEAAFDFMADMSNEDLLEVLSNIPARTNSVRSLRAAVEGAQA